MRFARLHAATQRPNIKMCETRAHVTYTVTQLQLRITHTGTELSGIAPRAPTRPRSAAALGPNFKLTHTRRVLLQRI